MKHFRIPRILPWEELTFGDWMFAGFLGVIALGLPIGLVLAIVNGGL